VADCGADGVDSSRGSFAEQVLELGKDLFDRVQVGRVFWQEEEFGADRTDELANCFASMAAEVIQDDDIAGSKDRQKNLLDIDTKAHAINRPLDEPWRIDPVMAQGRQEGHGLPAAVGNLGMKSAQANTRTRFTIGETPDFVERFGETE